MREETYRQPKLRPAYGGLTKQATSPGIGMACDTLCEKSSHDVVAAPLRPVDTRVNWARASGEGTVMARPGQGQAEGEGSGRGPGKRCRARPRVRVQGEARARIEGARVRSSQQREGSRRCELPRLRGHARRNRGASRAAIGETHAPLRPP